VHRFRYEVDSNCRLKLKNYCILSLKDGYAIVFIERSIDEFTQDRGFTHTLVPQENHFLFAWKSKGCARAL